MARAGNSSVLLAVGPLLQREVDLDELLGEIVRKIAAALDADRGTLYLVDPVAGELFSKAAHLPELREIRLKIGQGVAGTVAASGTIVNLPAAEGHRLFFSEIDRRTGYRTRSILAAPVRDRHGSVIGVVQVLNARRGTFLPDDEERLRRLCAETALVIENTSLWAQLRPHRSKMEHPPRSAAGYRYNRIVGESRAMSDVFELTRKTAATSATVLVRGESGTGKELIARAIHYNSARRDGPFVKVDCTTIAPALIENELFGHERGAFTGATGRSIGKCEQASGGTLFIDEIGEIVPPLQAKLLRFVQDHEFERLGGTRTVRADVRVVAATHRDLEGMVGRGEFREDLYYRLKVVQIALPPLRARGAADVVRLAEHFLDVFRRKHGTPSLAFTPKAMARLVQHRWPGNIRELENCIESAVVLADGSTIGPEHLGLAGQPPIREVLPAEWRPRRLCDVERDHIVRTLELHRGNRTRAAESLGIGRNTLLRKLHDYRIIDK